MNTRIVVLNSPRSIGAVLPPLTPVPTANSNGVCKVMGAPGTLPVPSPRPAAIPTLAVGPKATRLQPSQCSPTVIRPSLYLATPQCGMPNVYRGADRISPVPAVFINRSATKRMQQPKRIGGRTVTRNVRAIVRWPQYGGGYA